MSYCFSLSQLSFVSFNFQRHLIMLMQRLRPYSWSNLDWCLSSLIRQEKMGLCDAENWPPSVIRSHVCLNEMLYCSAWKHGVSSFVGSYSCKTNDVQNVCLRALWDHSWAAAHWCVSHANAIVFQSICHPITLTSLCTGACLCRWKEQNRSCLILKQIIWGTCPSFFFQR